MRGQFIDAAILQHDDAVREFQRLLGVGVFMDVAIQVGAGEGDNQRAGWKAFGKGADRGKAAPRVQRQHQIGGGAAIPLHLHPHRVARLAQKTRPAGGSMPVAVAMFAAVGRDESDAHGRILRLAGGITDNSRMNETAISSRDNPIFKRLKKLAESTRARREARMTLLDGEHLLASYLDAGGQPHTLVRAASFETGAFNPLAARCPQAKVIVLPDAMFAELAPVATPTGMLAEAAWLTPPAIDTTPLVIVLEDIQDPGNLGSMLRTGAASGATLAVLSKGCHDPWSPKALRGGQGAQFVLPLISGVDIVEWLAGF